MQSTAHSFLENAWYAAALSTEVDGQVLFHRKILDTSVLIYRKQDGTALAMADRCPHRFAPLHLGKREGDEIRCLYHGLRFNCSGVCTHSPHGDGKIPKAAVVRTFPLEERDGFLWIWMGEQPADMERLPRHPDLVSGPPSSVGYTYMHMKAHYELILDNVMDLSHIDHVHGEIITTRGQLSPLPPKVKEIDRAINSHWEWKQTPPMGIFAPFLPDSTAEARHYFDITFVPPGNIQLSVGAVQGERSFDECVGQYDLHTTTPESLTSTHYFFATRRNHIEDDAAFNDFKIKAMHTAFETEDGPVIEAVQAEMGTADYFSLNPVLTANDGGAVRMRRLLKRLIDEERANRQGVGQRTA